MLKIADPVTQWALIILASVVMGTCLLVALAFFRRWQRARYTYYTHNLRCKYRPVLAELLSGGRSPYAIEILRELPLSDLEILLDPVFSKRKLPPRCLVSLEALCAELGLIELWQRRLANEHSAPLPFLGRRGEDHVSGPAVLGDLLRAKGIRNLGMLRHQPSWELLFEALDDRHPDIQLVALQSLGAVGAPESFPALRERLHAVVQGESPSPPLQALQAAMTRFDVTSAPALFPSLRHPHRQIRLYAAEILRAIVCREAARQPGFALTPELLTPPMVELLLTDLAVDTSADIRARTAEVIVFLADARALPVLRDLLRDDQWFVRLRTVRALIHLRQAATPLCLDIRECLRDPHWRVSEAATQTLLALGGEGKHQLYEQFLISPDSTTSEQIVEVIERTGMMPAMVEEYSEGTTGVDALMVEQLASGAAPLGLSGALRTVNPATRQRFLDRYLPYLEFRMRFLEAMQPAAASAASPQQILEFPPCLAA